MVDFRAYDNLTKAEARRKLQLFLDSERKTTPILIARAEQAGLVLDFSPASLVPLFRWLVPQMRTIPRAPDPTVPEWLRSTESYHKGLYNFDDESARIVLRFAYYFGESFVRTFPCLQWTTGDRTTIEQNMPVVGPFKHGIELAPVMVSENLFCSVVEGQGTEVMETALSTWLSFVPSRQN